MPKNFDFVMRGYGEPADEKDEGCFIVVKDTWNDYGMHVKFRLHYQRPGQIRISIGGFKALRRVGGTDEKMLVENDTELPNRFQTLEDCYITLGQSEEYYRSLYENFSDDAEIILNALQDIALQPALAEDFEPTSAFRNALTRDNAAHRARRFGREWARGTSPNEKLNFAYNCHIDGAASPIETYIDFEARDVLPGRIVGIIGRNAVGKTRFLSQLSEDLAQISRVSASTISERDKRFPSERPLFTRIIAISYSAFDRFRRPSPDSSSSYVYCGIRNEKGVLSRKSLVDSYRRNQRRIRELSREGDWILYINLILGDAVSNLITSPELEISNPDNEEGALSLLSSGQSILCHYITALIAWIQPGSLILFDEPETHLHPNAVASLMTALKKLLDQHDCYALLATHSPLVVQEIPSKRVCIFVREDFVTTSSELEMECFGESISEITRHIFETIEVESLYKIVLRSLSRRMPAEEVRSLFAKGLSINAQAYLLAQYDSLRNKKQ